MNKWEIINRKLDWCLYNWKIIEKCQFQDIYPCKNVVIKHFEKQGASTLYKKTPTGKSLRNNYDIIQKEKSKTDSVSIQFQAC